jgi:hypothetical protein
MNSPSDEIVRLTSPEPSESKAAGSRGELDLQKLAREAAANLAMDSAHIPAIAQQILPALQSATASRDAEIERLQTEIHKCPVLVGEIGIIHDHLSTSRHLADARQQIESLTAEVNRLKGDK